jgi:hypothetical protein
VNSFKTIAHIDITVMHGDKYYLKSSFQARNLISAKHAPSHRRIITVIEHKIQPPPLQALQMCPDGVLIIPKYKLLARILCISANCLEVRYVFWGEVSEERQILWRLLDDE